MMMLPKKQQSTKLINERIQTNWNQKSNLLLPQRHYQSQKFWNLNFWKSGECGFFSSKNLEIKIRILLLEFYWARYEKFIILGDFHIEVENKVMKDFL